MRSFGMSAAALEASPPGGEEDSEEPARRPTGETFLELVRLRLPPPAAARRMLVGRLVRSRMLASGMMRSCWGEGLG